MVHCPQCGAELQITEQELYPACPYCATAFLLDGDQAARHLIVPFSHRGKSLIRVARDHLVRAGFPPAAVAR